MSEHDETPTKTTDWVEILNRQELGVVTATVQRVQAVLANDRSSLQDLSKALHQDPETTAKVLRVANSPAYMTGPEPVTSVVRASSLMGLDTIRNICVTNRLLEVLLAEHDLPERIRDRLLTRVAASLHAAVLARQILKGQDAMIREGVFIAALLDGIGECAFWSSRLPETLTLDTALQEPGCDPEFAVRQLLGGTFRDLSRALVQSWGLTSVLDPADDDAGGATEFALVVRVANEIAEAVASEGWQSSAVRRRLPDIAEVMGIETDEAAIRLNAWSKLAEEIAGCYGVGALARRMVYRPFEEAARRRALAGNAPVRALGTVSNPPRQARALREMSAAAREGAGALVLIQKLAEGVEEGLGMERVVAALLTPDRKMLQMRIALGENNTTWAPAFRFELAGPRGTFQECLSDNRCLHLGAREMQAPRSTVPRALVRFSTAQDFLLGPILVGARAIGALYCDRAPSATPIEPDEFEAFTRMLVHLGTLLGGMQRPNA
jgi:HDOD domain